MSRGAFTQEQCRTLKADITAALAAVEAKHGVKLSFPNRGMISDTGYEIKIALNRATATGDDAGAKRGFDLFADSYGLRPTDMNTEFVVRGETFKLVKLNTRRRAFPLECIKVATGETIFFRVGAVPTIRTAADRAAKQAA
jgi:hypothetical protein